MKAVLTFLFLGVSIMSISQSRNAAARSELGFQVGGMYYIGDLNRFKQFNNTHLSGGLIFRYEVNPRVSWRSNFIYGKVSADDAESGIIMNQQRNLNFNSTIWELSSGIEIHYFPFRIGDTKYRGTAYIFGQLGAFRMNPKTDYNGDEFELQPLGTEGQGTSLNSQGYYNTIQVVLPFGIGGKVSLGKLVSLGIEFGLRKTFTDYLDDVGSDTYVDYDQLLLESGPLAANLSNRSGDRYGKRGNSTTSDWYVFSGINLTMRLGDPTSCWSGR